MTRITGAEARHLLDIWEGDEDGLISARRGAYDNYGDMFEAAPDLAETVAWLYGREPDAEAVDGTERHWRDQTILTSRGAGALAMFEGNFIGYGDEMTPDEAVDLARALLAAAEEARQ